MVLGFNSGQLQHGQGLAASESVQRIIALIRSSTGEQWMTEVRSIVHQMSDEQKANLVSACHAHDNKLQREIIADDERPSQSGMRTQAEWAAEMTRLREVQSLLGVQRQAEPSQTRYALPTEDLRSARYAPEPVLRLQRELITALTNHIPHAGQSEAAEIRVIRALIPADKSNLLDSSSAEERIASLAFMSRSPQSREEALLLTRIVEMERAQEGTGLEFLRATAITASQEAGDEPWWKAILKTAWGALL